jgi:hypothetical protein
MKTNVGLIDRIVRLAIMAAAIWLFFTGMRPVWEWAALVVGVVLGVTAVVSFCPLYSVLNIHTNKNKAA